mgnify:CR=1
RREFLDDNKIYTQSELEGYDDQIRSRNVKGGVGKEALKIFKETLAHQVPAPESLEVMEDAVEENVTRQPESA